MIGIGLISLGGGLLGMAQLEATRAVGNVAMVGGLALVVGVFVLQYTVLSNW